MVRAHDYHAKDLRSPLPINLHNGPHPVYPKRSGISNIRICICLLESYVKEILCSCVQIVALQTNTPNEVSDEFDAWKNSAVTLHKFTLEI